MRLVRRPLAKTIGADDGEWLSKLALEVYDECWLDYCCDPTEIAERLGLIVETADDSCIVGTTLFCARMESRRETGLVIYRMLAQYLLNRRGKTTTQVELDLLCEELVLPRKVARQLDKREIEAAQRYAPVEFVHAIYMRHRGSGSMGKIRVGTGSTD